MFLILLDDLQAVVDQENSEQPLLSDCQYIDDNEDVDEDTAPNDTRSSVIKHKPRVIIPGKGGLVYKSTLVSLLNEDPNLSHDRCVVFCF